MDDISLFKKLVGACREFENEDFHRSARASKIEAFCIDCIKVIGNRDNNILLRSFTRCVMLLVSNTKFKALLRIAAALVQALEANTDCLCSTYAMGHLAQFERKNMKPLVLRTFDAILPVLRSVIKSASRRDKALVCMLAAKNFTSKAELKLGPTEVRLLSELVNAPMISKDVELAILSIEINQILYRRGLMEIPQSNEVNLKILTRLLDLANNPSPCLRKSISELIATIMYVHSTKPVTNEACSPSRDSVKLSTNDVSKQILTSSLSQINNLLKHIWKFSDGKSNPYLKHTVCMAYSSFMKMLGQHTVERNLQHLLSIVFELIEAVDYNGHDEEGLTYACYLGKFLINSAFIENYTLEAKRNLLDLLIKKYLMVWANPESKNDVPCTKITKDSVLWTVSILFPVIGLSELLEDPELSNTLIELINVTPRKDLVHILKSVSSVCIHSPKSSVKILHTLAFMLEQEFALVSTTKNLCEDLRKYSQAVSVILSSTRDKDMHPSNRVISLLTRIAIALTNTDYSKAANPKAIDQALCGLSIYVGLLNLYHKGQIPLAEDLVPSIKNLLNIYSCEDITDEFSIRGTLEIRTSIMDVLFYLFKCREMLEPHTVELIISFIEKIVDLASRTLDNYKQLLNNRYHVKLEIVSLFNLFLKKLFILSNIALPVSDWSYKLMYLSFRLICVQQTKYNSPKKKISIPKRSWKPSCCSIYLNIINNYTPLTSGYSTDVSGTLSPELPNQPELLDIYKPMVEFSSDPFSVKYWYYDFSFMDILKIPSTVEEFLQDNIQDGFLMNNYYLSRPGPSDCVVAVDNAIMVLSMALSQSNEFIVDFLSKLERSFYLSAKSERSEKIMEISRLNTIVCIYHMLEYAQKYSINVTDSHMSTILRIAMWALTHSGGIIRLVVCQVFKRLFLLPNTQDLLHQAIEKIVEEVQPNSASLALAHIYSASHSKNNNHHIHEITGYIVHKLSTCNESDIKWHLCSVSLLMKASMEPLLPYLEDILYTIRSFYLKSNCSNALESMPSSLPEACLQVSWSVGSILESIINTLGTQPRLKPELASLISDVYECIKIYHNPLAAISAMRCAGKLLNTSIPVNPSAEISYFIKAVGEGDSGIPLLLKMAAVECLFDIVKSKRYATDIHLNSLTTLIKLIYSTSPSISSKVLCDLHSMIAELIKLNVDHFTLDFIDICSSIFLDSKKHTIDDLEFLRVFQNTLSSSPSIHEDTSPTQDVDHNKPQKLRKGSSHGSIEFTSLYCSALLFRYISTECRTPDRPGIEALAYLVHYLRQLIELMVEKDSSNQEDPQSGRFTYIKHGTLVNKMNDLVRIACSGMNSEHKVMSIESHKLLHTIFKYLSNITYPGPLDAIPLVGNYQAQVLAIMRRTLSLDNNLKLSMLSLKILYMQTMNYLQDMSLASGDIETLASESIKRISEVYESGFNSDHHLIIKSFLTFIWCDIFTSVDYEDLENLVGRDSLKDLYKLCISHFGVHSDSIFSYSTMEAPLKTISMSERQLVEFNKFFFKLSIRIDTNVELFINVINSLQRHDDDFIAGVLFKYREEVPNIANTEEINESCVKTEEIDTQTVVLEEKCYKHPYCRSMISIPCLGAIKFCFDIINKFCAKNSKEYPEVEKHLEYTDNINLRNEEKLEWVMVAFNFLFKILFLQETVGEIYMRHDILLHILRTCELYYSLDNSKASEYSLTILSNLLHYTIRDQRDCNYFTKALEKLLSILHNEIPLMGTSFDACEHSISKDSFEHKKAVVITLGKTIGSLLNKGTSPSINSKLLIPVAYCILASLSCSGVYSNISPEFAEAISDGLRFTSGDSSCKEYVRDITLSVIIFLDSTTQISSAAKNCNLKVNVLLTIATLIYSVPSVCYSSELLAIVQKITSEFMQYGDPLDSIAIKCIGRICALSNPIETPEIRIFGERYIKTLLPSLLYKLISNPNGGSSIETIELLAKLQLYAPSSDKEDIYLKYLICILSRIIANGTNEQDKLRTCIGQYLLNVASTHSKFKEIVSVMCPHRRSALRTCMMEVSNSMT